MADLLISRIAPGVAAVRSVDPFDTLEIHRIDRSRWQSVPEKPGVFLGRVEFVHPADEEQVRDLLHDLQRIGDPSRPKRISDAVNAALQIPCDHQGEAISPAPS